MKRIIILFVSLLSFSGTVFAQSAIVPVGGDAQSNNDCDVGYVKKNAECSVRCLRN